MAALAEAVENICYYVVSTDIEPESNSGKQGKKTKIRRIKNKLFVIRFL